MRFAIVILAALLLSACASRPVQAPVAPVDPVQADAARREMADWRLSGRVAVSNGRQAGSGRLDWSQGGGRYDIRLSAPVTRQGWRLSGDAAAARLEGVEGGPREAADVEALLLGATGWAIPVRAMVDWVRGLAAPTARHGEARVVLDDTGLPAVIEQAGWRVEYRDWQPAGSGGIVLPRRVEATQGESRVRLVVDDWEPAAAPQVADDPQSPEALLVETLSTLRLEDPEADLLARLAAGDLRPVAVCGFACLAPGMDRAPASGPESVRIIDGTGDVVRGERHLALKRQAEAYARAYNSALAAWRARQDPVN